MTDKKANTIPVPMETVDAVTGKTIKTETVEFVLEPPPVGSCAVCGIPHHEREAHNAQSLFYQYRFFGQHARWPTWADAIAHCDRETRDKWERELTLMNAMTSPPVDVPAIAEPYAMQKGGQDGTVAITRDDTIDDDVAVLFQSLTAQLGGFKLDICEAAAVNLLSNVVHNVARMRGMDDRAFAQYARAMMESCYQNASNNWKRQAQPGDIPVRPN